MIVSNEAAQKEDVELTLLHYIRDKKVLRYNNVGFRTKFHAPGGLGKTQDRIEQNKKAALFLEKTYPQFVTVWTRPNGMYEVRLRDKTANKKDSDSD